MREEDARREPLTIDEYLALEEAATERHEYVAGRVYAMSGATKAHNRIAANTYMRLRAAERGGPCRAYIIDVKVRAGRDRIYYPDAAVTCGPDDNAFIIDDPCFVVEVTSPSTRRIDRGEKLDAYLKLPTLRAYLIVEQRRKHVTLYTRPAGGEWRSEEFMNSGTLSIPCPEMQLTLDEIYENVVMPPLRVSEPAWADPWVSGSEEIEVP